MIKVSLIRTTDILLRRTGLAWRRSLTIDEVERAADIVAPLLEWSAAKSRDEVADFLRFQTTVLEPPASGQTRAKPVQCDQQKCDQQKQAAVGNSISNQQSESCDQIYSAKHD